MEAQKAEHLRDHRRLVSDEERGRPRLGECVELLVGEELRDRRRDLAVGAEDDVGEPLRAPRLGHVLELLDLPAGELARHAQVPDGGRVREDAEAGAARQLGRVLDLEAEAQVGLVAPEPERRLLPAHAREGRLELDSEELAPDAHDDALG